MKTLFKLTIFGILLPMLSAIAFAQTGPQSIYIDCESPSGSQSDLKRPRGDGNVWVFQIVPGADVHWVEGPNWSYPGKGGTDPSWGQWNGGDGSLSLSWISPEHSGAFNIGVTGKITCGSGGGGGAPIDISAMWSGEVLAKEWKAEPAITGGEVTQPAGTENPKEVGPGETVNLAVSEATDQDTWTQGEESDQEADTVHYKWTSGDGGFVTDDHPDGDATEVTTASAQWKAPTEPGDYTVTCTIDDEPAAVEDPDTGERDDDPLTRTVDIKVVVGESSATLKLYKDAELTEEATGTIGGSVSVVLEVKLGKYQKLESTSATLRIEENYDQHSETERRWDRTVSFADGWKKKDANGEWQTTEATPQTKNSSGDDEYFRKVWSWATYSQPLGHNEQHTVEIVKVDGGEDSELSFTPTNEGDDGKDGPESVDADVANLVITDVSTNAGNPDYFKFDPDSTDENLINPTISFTVKDDGDKHRYKWWVWVMPTRGEPNSVEITGILDAPGSQEVTINQSGQDYSQDHPLTEWGAYTFDIRVQEIKDAEDEGIGEPWVDYRSQKLFIPSFYTDNGVQKPGHYLEIIANDDQGETKAEIGYYLEDSQGAPLSEARNAVSVEVEFLDPAQEVLTTKDLQTQVRVPHLEIELYTFNGNEGVSETQQDGTFRAIFTAEDGHGIEYRDHQNKRMVPTNSKQKIKYFHIEDDWMVHPTDGNLYPQARSTEMGKAFGQAGWFVVNATNSPKQVLPAAATSIPYIAIMNDGAERIAHSQQYFYYYDAKNVPAYVTQFRWGRYVHVVGAGWSDTYQDPPAGRILGQTLASERYSYIYVKDITEYGFATSDIRKVAIHEVGHQFSGHNHGDEATPEETTAYENGDIATLRKYRSRPSSGISNPNRDQFLSCVLEPIYRSTNDWMFCPYHRSKIRVYSENGW